MKSDRPARHRDSGQRVAAQPPRGVYKPRSDTELRQLNRTHESIRVRAAAAVPRRVLPEFLHHYTTHHGFHGIVESRFLRATDARYLNDPSESCLLFEILDDVSAKRRGEHPAFYGHVARRASRLAADAIADMSIIQRPFIASFTEVADDLNQWRAYSDDGRGFMLTFSTKWFKGRLAGGEFVPVCYDHNEAVKAVEAVCEGYISALNSRRSQLPPDVAGTRLFITLAQLGTFFKSSGYASEREWRWVRRRGGLTSHADGSALRTDGLAPYIRLPIKMGRSDSVDQVMTGPACRPRPMLALRAAMDHLLSKDFRHFAIQVSSLEYRSSAR